MAKLRFHWLDGAACVSFLAYSASAVLTPICLVILASELSLTLAQGGTIEVARSLLILLVLLASGFAAARWGKASVLGMGLVVLGVGLGLYAMAPVYGVIVMAAALVGLGGGVVEGLINPLVQELHPSDSGRYLNIVNGFWSVGVLLTVLITGDLLTRNVSWRVIAASLAGFSVLAGGLFLFLARHAPHVISHTAGDVLGHKREILTTGRFWLFVPMMFLAGGAEGAFTFWSASYIQLHHQGLPRAGGIGTACFAGGMIVGRFAGGWLIEQRHLRRFIILSALAGLGISFLVPKVQSLETLYTLLVLAGLSVACFWPSIQSYAVDRLPVEPTALFILLSCAGIPGFAFVSWLMGFVGDRAGLRASFFVVPAFFALLLFIVIVERACRPRSTDPPGEAIQERPPER
ncbi:MAG: MFS transporter [Phycisphaerae bacterium]|nr:MFS transporter [Phycisphaerae bacterium]